MLPESHIEGHAPDPRGASVLLVEDEQSIAEPFAHALTRNGFRTTVARTVSEALELAAKLEPDLVLLDLALPGPPGTEVCRSLRERSDVPVIMMSAKDTEVDKAVGLELGADDYVTKPFSWPELAARIQAILQRPRD